MLNNPPILLNLLDNKLRWHLVSALSKGDFNVSELQNLVKSSQNLVSYHLGKLKSSKLVNETQSIADGRETYYSLNLRLLQSLFFSLADDIHPALSQSKEDGKKKNERPARVLFVCTHNSARSQMAEGLLRANGGEFVEVFSAGTEPSHIHPLAIQAMEKLKVDISQQRSKDISEFINQKFDYVITVCDRAKESCPIFPGAPEQIHWSFPDPSEVEGDEVKKAKAFYDTALGVSQRINFLLMMIKR
jgi:protein-tyrosine-phosphatase/DNA-binding transcriptional ArsR family regulator